MAWVVPVGAPQSEVPRIFQVLVALYVIITGQIPVALQATFFGLTGGGQLAFTAAFISAMAVDVLRLAPLFLLARHPLGILHPLILAVLIWPIIIGMASTIEDFGGLGGLFLGNPVEAPHFMGLGWLPAQDVWWGTAFYNALQFIALAAIYGGFVLFKGREGGHVRKFRSFDSLDLRRLLLFLIGAVFVGIAAFIYYRGGLDAHLADLSRGRFRSLAGLGPLLALFDLGTVALVIWMAARPQDAKNPIFVAAIIGVAATQFVSNGSRSATLAVFTTVALAWCLRTRRIPWRLAVIMIPLIFLGLGLMNIARTSGFSNESAIEAVTSADTEQVLQRVQEEIAERQALTSSVPVVADGFRTTGPLLGRSYIAAIFAMVPRALWETKPRGPGSIYAQVFLGEEREGMAIPVSPTAEAYWNFGIIGVILLPMLYGMLLGRVHRLYLANDTNPFIISFFLLFVTIFQMATDNIVLFQQQLLMFGAIYLLAKFTTRPAEAPGPAVYRRPAPPLASAGPAV